MDKIVAIFSLMTLMALNTMANFWYTYGIWPRSWTAFFGFWFSGMVLFALLTAVSSKK